jgi:predicted ABC-type ATPase
MTVELPGALPTPKGALRAELVKQRESFIFETVFSDPVGDKLGFLKTGRSSRLCGSDLLYRNRRRRHVRATCGHRVSQGGHDVPTRKLLERFPRTLANLVAALGELPRVLVFDNDDLRTPFRQVAIYTNGRKVQWNEPIPYWLKSVL